MPAYTIAALTTVLGTEFYSYNKTSKGVQVNLNLDVVQDDLEKCELLIEAYTKLEQAGYNVTRKSVRLSVPPRTRGGRDGDRKGGGWTPWPCIFVNEPEASSAGATQGFSAEQVVRLIEAIHGKVDPAFLASMLTGAGDPATAPDGATAEDGGTDGSAKDDVI